MTIQAIMSNVSETVSNAVSFGASGAFAAAQWLGRSVVALGQTIAQFAQSAVAVAQPYFSSLKDFVVQNQGSFTVAAVGVAVGALGYALVSSLFCSRQPRAVPATGV